MPTNLPRLLPTTDPNDRVEVFERFVNHIRGILRNEAPVKSDVMARGVETGPSWVVF